MKLPPKSIQLNPDGSATAKVYIRGRRHQKKCSTRKLAEDWLTKQKLELERDEIYGRGDRVLFSTLINQYRQEKTKSGNSVLRDSYILKRVQAWLKDRGVKYASDIKKGLMAEYERDRRRNGIAQRTANMDIKLIAAILNHALKRDRIEFNPLAAYPYQSDGKPFTRYLTADEIDAMLLACKGPERIMIYAAVTLGLRAEEISYLQFSDCKNNVLRIGEKKIKDHAGFERVWRPKWNKERWIPLDHEYINDAELMEFFAGKKTGYCFPNPDFKDGRPMDRNGILKRVKRIARDAGIQNAKEVKAHTLRHTHVSYMVARIGIDRNITIRHIMDYVGINDLRTLMIYTKAVKDLSRNLPDPTRFPWQKPVTKK